MRNHYRNTIEKEGLGGSPARLCDALISHRNLLSFQEEFGG
jgi:hypothetical protein